ncbi:DsbA family oxidoreductase [Actinoalloteichus caeruleus]|uniref:DsbA family oxidoreductase n=1 Tax=Actinoalloteichus cyanogriseus TaxID=2893586 RepID=UPI0004C28658|nr:DsbA family oxidoreductase [Actinoalloteichus caeruleus]
MRVDIWSDLVCPWCYLGKKRFERALDAAGLGDRVEVVYRSFQLDPGFPRGETRDQAEVLAAKFGTSREEAARMATDMERTAAGDGLEFRMGGLRYGNTFDAHRLVQCAAGQGTGPRMVERLFRAHFSEQRSLFDRDSLVLLATEAGVGEATAGRVLDDGDAYADAVRADLDLARRLGVSGVPFFVLDGRYGVSGAQPVEVLARALATAAGVDERAADPTGGEGGAACAVPDGAARSGSGSAG